LISRFDALMAQAVTHGISRGRIQRCSRHRMRHVEVVNIVG
jgi:hypothetical protein